MVKQLVNYDSCFKNSPYSDRCFCFSKKNELNDYVLFEKGGVFGTFKNGKLGIDSENNKDTNQPLNSACLENRCLSMYWFTKRG